MDFGSSCNEYNQMCPMEYQQWNANDGVATNMSPPEQRMDIPGISLPPPRFPQRFTPRGRHQRRNKFKHHRFDHFTSPCRHQHHPQDFTSPYDSYQNGFGDRYGSKYNTEFDYSWEPRGYVRNFNPNALQFTPSNYPMASADCYGGQACGQHPIGKFAATEKIPGLYPDESQMKSSKSEPYYPQGPRVSKNNASQRKRKRQSPRELVEIRSVKDVPALANVTDNVFPVSDCSTSNHFITTSPTITAVQHGDKKDIDNYDPTETQLAVDSLGPSHPDFSPNLELSCGNFLESQVPETVTLYANDEKVGASLNSDGFTDVFSMLNDMFSGIGDGEKSVSGKVSVDKKENNASPSNCALLPYSTVGSDTYSTTVYMPTDPVISLIQQNQILIDLLARVINNSDVFKMANGDEVKTIFSDQNLPETRTSLFPTQISVDDSPFLSECVSQSTKESVPKSKEGTDTLLSNDLNGGSTLKNETAHSTTNTAPFIDHDGCQIHVIDSVFDKNYLTSSDSFKVEEISKVETKTSLFSTQISAHDFPFLSECVSQSTKESVPKSKEGTDTLLSSDLNGGSTLENETAHSTTNTGSFIDHDGCQIHFIDSVFDKNYLTSSDSFKVEEISEVETTLHAVTNYVSDKPESICPDTAAPNMEKTNNQIEDNHCTNAIIEREEVKTIVRKSSIRKKMVSRIESPDEQKLKQCQVISTPLSDNSVSDSSSINCSGSHFAQAQSVNNESATDAETSEESKAKRLRSDVKCNQQISDINEAACLESCNPNAKAKDEEELHALLCIDIYSKRKKGIRRNPNKEKNGEVLEEESGSNLKTSKTNLASIKRRRFFRK